MADNVVVSNSPTSSNTDIPARTSETAAGKHIQHFRLDLGSGTAEAQASGSIPIATNFLSGAGTSPTTFAVTGEEVLLQAGIDLTGTARSFRPNGETPAHVASTDNTQNNSQYLLVDANEYLIIRNKATTSSLSNVASSATSVTLLSSNILRLGATIYNDSTAILYVKFGTTASTTSFTIKMQPDGYYEIPFGYTGRIDGIWASATGSARVMELSA